MQIGAIADAAVLTFDPVHVGCTEQVRVGAELRRSRGSRTPYAVSVLRESNDRFARIDPGAIVRDVTARRITEDHFDRLRVGRPHCKAEPALLTVRVAHLPGAEAPHVRQKIALLGVSRAELELHAQGIVSQAGLLGDDPIAVESEWTVHDHSPREFLTDSGRIEGDFRFEYARTIRGDDLLHRTFAPAIRVTPGGVPATEQANVPKQLAP